LKDSYQVENKQYDVSSLPTRVMFAIQVKSYGYDSEKCRMKGHDTLYGRMRYWADQIDEGGKENDERLAIAEVHDLNKIYGDAIYVFEAGI